LKSYYKDAKLNKFARGLITNIDVEDIPGDGFTHFLNFTNGRKGGSACKIHGTKDSGCSVPAGGLEVIQLYFASLDKAGVKTGYLFAQLKGTTNGLDLWYCEYDYATNTWGSWTELVGTATPYGGAVKADKVNFANFRSNLRVGCGHYADSFPLWIGYINREKDTDLHGYFNNLVEYQGLYVARAELDECDINALINTVTVLETATISVGLPIDAGILISRKNYFLKAVYEFDGYQQGNAARDKYYMYTPVSNAPGVSDNYCALNVKLRVDSSTFCKRLSGISIYAGETFRDYYEEDALIPAEPIPEDLVNYHRIVRLDINDDTELFNFNGMVVEADGLNVMQIVNPGHEVAGHLWWDYPDEIFTGMYIKYRQKGTSTWTTIAISSCNNLGNSAAAISYLKVVGASAYAAVASGTTYYEVKIMARWVLVPATNYYTIYFVLNGQSLTGAVYQRKFGDVNYDRPSVTQGRIIAAGCYLQQDAPEDKAEYKNNLWCFSEINSDGNPEPDKLSGFFFTDIDSDDKALIATDYKWSTYYPDRFVILWHKKSIHIAKFDANGVMSLDQQPYPVGLIAPDSLWFDGQGYYFLGREKHWLDVFYFNPQTGKPKRIGYPIADIIKSWNKKNIDRAVGWYDAEHKRYMIAIPEFEA